MGVSIMLTIIPRPPPGSGLFLQGKAWAGKPWDSRTGTKSHLLASLPFTAIAISLVPPTLCSFPSLFSPSLVFSFCILFSLYFPFSPYSLYWPWLMATGFSKWYSELPWLLGPGGRGLLPPGPLVSWCPQLFHLRRYPIRVRFSVSFCRGSKVQGHLSLVTWLLFLCT